MQVLPPAMEQVTSDTVQAMKKFTSQISTVCKPHQQPGKRAPGTRGQGQDVDDEPATTLVRSGLQSHNPFATESPASPLQLNILAYYPSKE